jgi:hypothetical protein
MTYHALKSDHKWKKLSPIEVLTLGVRVNLNVHAYIQLYLKHICQKHIWNDRISAHSRSKLHAQTRKVKKSQKKKKKKLGL